MPAEKEGIEMKPLRERTEIQQAYLDGKQVQVKLVQSLHFINDGSIKWRDCTNLCFDSWYSVDYRIKPKPMERWVNIYDNQEDVEDYLHLSEEDAENDLCADGRTVHFIEVK